MIDSLKLKGRIIEKGYSQKIMAEKIGVSKGIHIARIRRRGEGENRL